MSAGSATGSFDVVGEPAEILKRVGNALQKMRFALIEAAKSIGAQSLHDPDINVSVVVLHERVAIERE